MQTSDVAAASPTGPRALAPLFHFLEHQFLRFRTTFRGTIIGGTAGPLMYLLGIGLGLGSQIDATASGLGTDTYIDFVGPGLMAASAMQLGASESLWQTSGLLKYRGIYVSIAATPLSIAQLFTGHVIWIGFRVLVGATLYLMILTAFGVPSSPLAVLAPFAAVLTGTSFAALISAWTGYAKNEVSFPAILRLLIVPMYLFSGAFYPVDQLPRVLEIFARLTPVWHGVRLCRGLISGEGLSAASASGHLAVLVGFTMVGVIAGSHTFRRAIGE